MPLKTAQEKLIVALDVPSLEDALALVRTLRGEVSFFKLGLSLFTRFGPEGVAALKGEGMRLFLDLKFHDIPAVVAEAAFNSALMGADMMTVHVSGGEAMMKAAAEGAGRGALERGLPPPVILGVTVLTSLDRVDLEALDLPGALQERVKRWGGLAARSGLGGLVASAREAAALRPLVGPDFVIVTPGIRPAGTEVKDQKRVVTPAEAMRAGSDYLVVGRPVTAAADPVAAVRVILQEIASAV